MGLVRVNTDSDKSKEQIISSWKSTIAIHETDLRLPQKSALLKCLDYDLNDEEEPVIINMPTGTGKTGVIASLLFKAMFKRTLIVVPSDSLRKQISDDLVDFKKYIDWKVIPENSEQPIISRLEPQGIEKIIEYDLEKQFIVVATSQIFNSFQDENLKFFLNQFDRLIFDEAHHSEAPTWKKLRNNFIQRKKKIFQFTATPYRGDGKKLEGKLIYQYSIAKAFDEGIFEKIQFEAVSEYYDDKSDEVVARKALEVLEKDSLAGLEHVLMVKTSTIKHARMLKKIYTSLIKEYFPKKMEVLLATSHDGINEEDKIKLKKGRTKIVVCVDMFGEGYDLPNLKILALHKKCKSLPIFMQLVGRFTRVNRTKNIGQATIISNVVADDISEQFQELYQVDADWNLLIGNLSKEKMIEEFFSSSIDGDYNHELIRKLFSSNSFYIKNSATIHKEIDEDINDIFEKNNLKKFFNKLSDKYISAIFKDENLGIILSRKKITPMWVSSDELQFDSFDIFIFLKKDTDLFIHGSNKDLVQSLAKELGFVNYSFPELFRIFYNLERSAFANLGMLSTSRNIRFRMFTGTDVYKELTQQDLNNNAPSNLFGHGYIDGKKASLGCSRKGITWSMSSANVYQWVKWCESLYEKIHNNMIPVNSFVNNMLEPFSVENLENFNILTISPVDLISKAVNLIRIKGELNSKILNFNFYEIVSIKTENEKINFSIKLYFEDDYFCILNYTYNLADGFTLISEFCNGIKLNCELDFIKELPTKLGLFAWTSSFEVISLNEKIGYRTKYSYTLVEGNVTKLDWTGVDTNKESWKFGEVKNSVQGKIIELLQSQKNRPNILFYDDGSNELADLVGFWIDEAQRKVCMRLYHCKYAIGEKSSIEAVNELVQQTLSTCDKLSDAIKALKQLKTRENNTYKKTRKTRFILGDMSDLDALIKKYRTYDVTIEIVLVQPSLDYSALSSRVNSVLGQLACIIKQTLHAETYYIIK
ncbi:DEAD/DEAH box helicase family protein [Acinetobacter sp. ME22]|uniref:DEAD/DEAH box helicase n=1 Tax=Acinetobacter sp. ME22 TaxID=2904802 RepID=UPI001EDB9B83|nr:DEAD/DEAH box helicase family protein [Acinetobacter sp. ME22]MCG2575125.1 DEAD/DEAH box helicase family protein [Acinetobacter sp. ME22]